MNYINYGRKVRHNGPNYPPQSLNYVKNAEAKETDGKYEVSDVLISLVAFVVIPYIQYCDCEIVVILLHLIWLYKF